MANKIGNFVLQRNQADQQYDQQRMPPPSLNLNRSAILPAGPNSPRSKLLGSKFTNRRSIPTPVTSSPKQPPIVGAHTVIHKLNAVGVTRSSPPLPYHQNGGQQVKDAFDTDLGSTTGTEDSLDTLNAVGHNQTRLENGVEEYDGQGPYMDEGVEDGYMDENGQHYQNGAIGQSEQIDGDGQLSEGDDEEEEEDDEDMPMNQHGQGVNGGYDGRNFPPYLQPQKYAQSFQQQQVRDFDDVPIRGGSPNHLTSRMTNTRNPNFHAPARRLKSAPQMQMQEGEQYKVPDKFAPSSVADEESGSEEEVDAEEVDQQVNGYVQPQNQPPYQNNLQVHPQQQKPRHPNPMLDPSGKPVWQRLEEVRAMTGGGGGTFEPSDFDETVSFEGPVVPPKKGKTTERRRASPSLVRKRAASLELDYEKPTLFNMQYSELANQPFETKPPSHRPNSVVVKGKGLSEKLEKAMQLPDESRMEFLNGLPIKDWEEAGGWFVGRFGDVMKIFVDLRKERRATADWFEKRLADRNVSVQRSVDKLKSEMADMRKGGEGILRGKSPGGF